MRTDPRVHVLDIHYLRDVIGKYVLTCPVCKACRLYHQKLAGKLHPIDVPFVPFCTLTTDFITGLPVTANGYDAIMTVTDKATRIVPIIPGKLEGDALYWAIRLWDYVISQWGLPKAIISDRDGRFISHLWQALFKKVGTTLAITTAYNPKANGATDP